MNRVLAVLLGGLVLWFAPAVPAGAEQLAFNRSADYPRGASWSTGRIAGEADEGLVERAQERLQRRLQRHPEDTEARLLLGLIHFREGAHARALEALDAVVRRAPDFQLAHLVRGDLLLSRSRVIAGLGGNGVAAAVEGEGDLSRNALRAEARARLEGYLESLRTDRVPAALLRLSPSNPVALLVDKRHNRLYVYQRRGDGEPPRRVRDHYVSTGRARGNKVREGDLRTPEGVYFVQDFLEDGQLPAEYGLGAFTLDYPNPLDRHRGKTGYGIWLHGTDRRFFSRPPLDSEGCVVLPNLNLQGLRRWVRPGTPVVIAERLDWIERDRWRSRRESARAAVEQWRRSWEAMAVERYLAWYDEAFWSPSRERRDWVSYKRRVLAGKTEQEIRISEQALFAYPDADALGEAPVVVARFHQDYDSNNYRGVMDKQLYLQREAGEWSILYEGPAP